MVESGHRDDAGSEPRDEAKAYRYLVRSPNPLGDACMSLPAVRALRRTHERVHVTVCCRENLAAVWEAREEIDEVIPFSRSLSPRQVGRLLREHGRFDCGVLLPNSLRSALELRWGGVSNLVGYRRFQRIGLVRRTLPEPDRDAKAVHHVHRYLAIAERIGADVSDLDDLLALPATPLPIPKDATRIHLGICPGAEYGNAKRYPVERYAAAVEELRKRRSEVEFSVSVFGSPAEREIGEDLVGRLASPARNRAGETSLTELVEELRTCHFLATNDTGTMHLAAALGVPTVAIFGSTEPALTAPVGTIHRVIRHQVDCSPCFLRECPIDYRCMLRVAPEVVTGEMEALLDSATEE